MQWRVTTPVVSQILRTSDARPPCNAQLTPPSPNPLNQPLPKDIINVKAGDKLAAEWHHTLDSTPATDSSDPIDPGHLGPIMVYLAKVDSALTTTVTGLNWFKIYEDGMDANGTWAVTRLYNNKGKVEFTLPKCVQNGQ